MENCTHHTRSIGFWAHQLAMVFKGRVNVELVKLGITTSESIPLMLLHFLGPQSLVEMARKLNFAHPSVLRHIDLLERKGLVIRQPHSIDRRVKVVSLTPLGEDLIPKITEILKVVHNRAVSDMTDDETLALATLMRKVFFNLYDDKTPHAEFLRMVTNEKGFDTFE